MPALLTSRLDEHIERSATRTVSHPSRVKIYYPNGRLKQVFPTSRIKHSFDLAHGMRSRADYDEVIGAFYVILGNAYAGMLFRDIADYQGTVLNTALTETDTPGTWQLERLYGFGGIYYHRKITRPTGTIVVYDALGAPLSATVDSTTGLAVLDPDDEPDSWAGNFNVPVTFKNDEWLATLETHPNNLHLRMQPIVLEELFE